MKNKLLLADDDKAFHGLITRLFEGRGWEVTTAEDGVSALEKIRRALWVVKGKTNRDIGDILGSSPATVKKQLESVFAKMGVETRTAAAGLALSRVGQALTVAQVMEKVLPDKPFFNASGQDVPRGRLGKCSQSISSRGIKHVPGRDRRQAGAAVNKERVIDLCRGFANRS